MVHHTQLAQAASSKQQAASSKQQAASNSIHRNTRSLVLAAFAACASTAALAQIIVPDGASMSVPPGSTLNLACTTIDVAGNLELATSQINSSSGVHIQPGGDVNGGSSTIHVSGNWNDEGNFTADNSSVIFDDSCSTDPVTLSGRTVFNHLTLSSNSGRTFVLPEGNDIIVNGTLTLLGTPEQPITLTSSGDNTAVISLGPDAQVVQTHADVGGDVQIGEAPAPQPQPPVNIPTLSEWGRLATVALMALLAARVFRRRYPRI